jgi:hypothetical protein
LTHSLFLSPQNSPRATYLNQGGKLFSPLSAKHDLIVVQNIPIFHIFFGEPSYLRNVSIQSISTAYLKTPDKVDRFLLTY